MEAPGIAAEPEATKRHRLIEEHLGPYPEHADQAVVQDYDLTYRLLDACIGRHLAFQDAIFFRCMGCHEIRMAKALAEGPCKNCGGTMLNRRVGRLTTARVRGILDDNF